MFFYLVFCLLLYFRGGTRDFFVVYALLYFFLCGLLTLPKVNFCGGYLTISFGSSPPKFSSDLSPLNVFLNFALVFPLGNMLKSVGTTLPQSFLIGTLVGSLIEFLQFVIPCGRVVDPIDILLCGVGTMFFYFIFPQKVKRRRQF